MGKVDYNKVRIIEFQVYVINISIVDSYKWENILSNLHKDLWQIMGGKSISVFYYWFVFFFLVEPKLSPDFNVS